MLRTPVQALSHNNSLDFFLTNAVFNLVFNYLVLILGTPRFKDRCVLGREKAITLRK